MEELFGLARTTTLAQLLERDDFARRHEADRPISILELLYPLLQGYDSVAVRADVELGGTDQTFNLLLARDVQRAYGVPEQVVVTVPILPGTDGTEKMSKSVGNHVGITEPPEEMFGKTMSLPDDAMATWFDLLAVAPPAAGTPPRDAKRALARALVERFHGPAPAAAAEARFDRLHVRHELPEEAPELEVRRDHHGGADPHRGAGGAVHLPALLADGFGVTRSEARRLLSQGGVRLDGEPLGGEELDVPAARLEGRVLQVGKRQFRRLRLAP
jgi:tyrosyl-tRNA synthetase